MRRRLQGFQLMYHVRRPHRVRFMYDFWRFCLWLLWSVRHLCYLRDKERYCIYKFDWQADSVQAAANCADQWADSARTPLPSRRSLATCRRWEWWGIRRCRAERWVEVWTHTARSECRWNTCTSTAISHLYLSLIRSLQLTNATSWN